jgi:hypothetical protein
MRRQPHLPDLTGGGPERRDPPAGAASSAPAGAGPDTGARSGTQSGPDTCARSRTGTVTAADSSPANTGAC